VQQHLIALAMRLQLVGDALKTDPSAAEDLLDEAARDVQDALDEAARLAQLIRPHELDTGDLAAALRSWARRADVRATIQVRLDAGSSPEVAEAIYFCCLGALEHVSSGAHVRITVNDDDGRIAFEVVQRDSPGADFGALRNRVEGLGGDLALDTGSHEGTRVSGSIRLSLRR
jgi:signal transduction histidine kinase